MMIERGSLNTDFLPTGRGTVTLGHRCDRHQTYAASSHSRHFSTNTLALLAVSTNLSVARVIAT